MTQVVLLCSLNIIIYILKFWSTESEQSLMIIGIRRPDGSSTPDSDRGLLAPCDYIDFWIQSTYVSSKLDTSVKISS